MTAVPIAAFASSPSCANERREPCFDGVAAGQALQMRVTRYISSSASPCEALFSEFSIGGNFTALVIKTAIKDADQDEADHCQSLVLNLSPPSFELDLDPVFVNSNATDGSASSIASATYSRSCAGELYFDLAPTGPATRFAVPARDVPALLQIRLRPTADASSDAACPPACSGAFYVDLDTR